jgi:tetrahydromethanopterin S-methyltransferase subunit G
LIRSFSNVKNDTQKLFQWLNYLHQKDLDQESQIKQLKLELSYIPKKPEDIRKIIDTYYSFDNIMERLKMVNERIDGISKERSEPYMPQTHPEMHEVEQRLTQLEEQRKATIRDKVVKRVTRNSKEYVKQLMLSYIRKYTQIGALQLKDMVVYDQGLCSKSSFYRLLDEIEALDDIGIVKKGKQKYYLYKQLKEQ